MTLAMKWSEAASLAGTRSCGACGATIEGVAPDASATIIQSCTACYRAVVGGAAESSVSSPLAPGSWSPLGYIRHVGNELHVQAQRIEDIFVNDEPVLDFIVGSQRIRNDSRSVDAALATIAVSADRLSSLIAGASQADWSRRGYRNGRTVTGEQLVSEAAHEVFHHLVDVGRISEGAGGFAPVDLDPPS